MDAVRLGPPRVSVYTVPTDAPESDGTLAWDATTTLVLVQIGAGGCDGLGFSYADAATGRLIRDSLAGVIEGRNALDIAGARGAMTTAIRSLGRPGIAAMAIAAVDNALWSLHVVHRCAVERSARRLVRSGIGMVKMKVGREPQPTTTCIEHMLFDGALAPIDGALRPDRSRLGIGLALKTQDAAKFAVA